VVDFADQFLNAIDGQSSGLLLELMAQLGQPDGAHIAAAAFEAVGGFNEPVATVSRSQDFQALFGVRKKDIQQIRIALFHHFLQCTQHAGIHMYVVHLLTP
jgi:hypothetical protein